MLESFSIEIPEEKGSVAVSYYDIGASDSVLVALHGIQGSKLSFEPLIGACAGEHFRVVVPDLPGFGDSGVPERASYTLEDHVERLVAFFDMLELGRISILGHSLGGMLGTLLLQIIPDRIASFINLEGNLRGLDCGESRRVASMSLEEFKAKRLPELKENADPFLRAGMSKVQPDAFYETALSIVAWAESEQLLNTLAESEIPVLFVKAANGRFASDPKGKMVRTLVVPDTDHFTLGRSPVLFDAVTKFLRDRPEQ